jgi:hypothetical protein
MTAGSAPGHEHLPGTPLPGGTFTIPPEEDRRYRELVHGGPSPDGSAHPLWAFIATLRGMGITIGETLALAGTDIEADGPMHGEIDIELCRPLQTGVPYRLSGEVRSIERKAGRSLGTFDLLRLRYTLADDDGPAAYYTTAVVLPRREAS